MLIRQNLMHKPVAQCRLIGCCGWPKAQSLTDRFAVLFDVSCNGREYAKRNRMDVR
jgi:hypothetical protein